jgi:hypothetical protein
VLQGFERLAVGVQNLALTAREALPSLGELVEGSQAGFLPSIRLAAAFGAGVKSVRRTTETPFNMVLEARP